MAKYPPLLGVCKDCQYKCFRCEDINFTGVPYCKYNPPKTPVFNERKGEQERIKI